MLHKIIFIKRLAITEGLNVFPDFLLKEWRYNDHDRLLIMIRSEKIVFWIVLEPVVNLYSLIFTDSETCAAARLNHSLLNSAASPTEHIFVPFCVCICTILYLYLYHSVFVFVPICIWILLYHLDIRMYLWQSLCSLLRCGTWRLNHNILHCTVVYRHRNWVGDWDLVSTQWHHQH